MKTEMRFPKGKKKALTFSYDDATIYDKQLVALMNQYGMKGTFNLNAGLFSDKHIGTVDGKEINFERIHAKEVKALYEGHEVASHAFTHPFLQNISKAEVIEEITKDRELLEALVGYEVTGFAYPYGTYNDEVEETLKECGIVYARTVNSTGQFDYPEDFLQWHPTCHHDDPKLMELAKQFCEEDASKAKLFYIWGHSFEFHRYENWSKMEALFRYMQDYREDIWVATNMEIKDYIQAFEKLQWSEDGTVKNPADMDVWFEVDDTVYCLRNGETMTIA